MKNSIFSIPDDLLKYLTTHANSLKNYLPIEQHLEGMPCKSFYGDLVFESLLLHTLPKIEDLVGKKLWPTYSFFRSYIKNSLLPKHTDRPACEYSTTIYLNSSNPEYPYPIFVDNIAITLKAGQGVVYKGCEQQHWREPYPHDFSNHVFLHYIEQTEENRKYKYDEREYLYRNAVKPNMTQG